MDGVLEVAREAARAFEAELHLVHVREIATVPVFPAATIGYPAIGMPAVGMPGGVPVDPAEYMPPQMPEEQKTQLDRLRENLTREGLRAFAHDREGTVAEQILETARCVSADLIVMGSHGHGSVYNLLIGSVTEGVLKGSDRPLLLVPARTRKK